MDVGRMSAMFDNRIFYFSNFQLCFHNSIIYLFVLQMEILSFLLDQLLFVGMVRFTYVENDWQKVSSVIL